MRPVVSLYRLWFFCCLGLGMAMGMGMGIMATALGMELAFLHFGHQAKLRKINCWNYSSFKHKRLLFHVYPNLPN
jgi:hypothetical protein